MARLEHDVLNGQDLRKNSHQNMHVETHDLEELEENITKRLAVVEEKIDSIMDDLEQVGGFMQGIHAHNRRRRILWYTKWIVLLLALLYLYFTFVAPVVEVVSERYALFNNTLEENENQNNTGSSFGETIDELFPDLDTLWNKMTSQNNKENNATSTVEN